jgi:hypothetical protein
MAETIEEVVARLREIDQVTPPSDGIGAFDRVYLIATERIAADLYQVFDDPVFIADLDIRFAALFLAAYDAPAGHEPTAWKPVFEQRSDPHVLPVQYALAGMNTHIEHDLPLAVVSTCQARDTRPDAVRRDYDAVNGVLAEVEERVRRSFLDEVGRAVDDHLEPVAHLVASWDIQKAREVAWVSTETLWQLRGDERLSHAFQEALAHTVGMGSRILLTPVTR